MTTPLIESLEGRQLFANSFFDTTFAGGGVATISFKGTSANQTIGQTQIVGSTDGATYVMARVGKTAQVRRLTAAGVLNAAFASKKRNTLVFPTETTSTPAKIGTDTAGRLLVLIGRTISRFDANGELDATFGTNGSVTLTDFKSVTDFDTDANNKIYFTGSTKAGANVFVGRLISRGKYDKTFDADGLLALPQPKTSIVLTARTAQGVLVRAIDNNTADTADDGVVVAGVVTGKGTDRTYEGTEAARLNADGTYFTGYGRGGIASVYAGGSYSDTENGDFSTSKTIAPAAIFPNGSVTLLGTDRTDVGGDPSFTQYDSIFDLGTYKTFGHRISENTGKIAATPEGGIVFGGGTAIGILDRFNTDQGTVAGTSGTQVGYVDASSRLLVTALTRNGQRLNVARLLATDFDV